MKANPSPSLPNEPSCAVRLKALGDETRLAVVRHLMKAPCHVGDIQEALGIEQSLLSHHLKNLRDAGIVEATRDGKAMLYRLSAAMEQRRDGIVDLGCCQISFSEAPEERC
jgi:DNA-binding transcriptional ArsR family regulator